jgi:hypothetical protein
MALWLRQKGYVFETHRYPQRVFYRRPWPRTPKNPEGRRPITG